MAARKGIAGWSVLAMPLGSLVGGGGPWNQISYQCLVREACWSAVKDLLRSKQQISLLQWAFFTFCAGGSFKVERFGWAEVAEEGGEDEDMLIFDVRLEA